MRRLRTIEAEPEPEPVVVEPVVERPAGPRLGELLVQRNMVSSSQIVEALVQQSASGKRLGTLLVELGALDERSLAQALAQQLDLPMVDLRKELPEALAVSVLDESTARSLMAIPVRRTDTHLEVAVADPLDTNVAVKIATIVGGSVRLLIAPPSEIRRAIDISYRALAGVKQHVQEFEATESARVRIDAPDALALHEDAPVVQVVNLIMTQALRDRASDVHIEPQDDRLRIRFRIDGALHDVLALPASMAAALVSRVKIMADMNIVERRRSQDGQFQLNVEGRAIDVRVATTATLWGEKAVLRVLDKSRPLYRLSDLGMPVGTHELFSRIVRSPFGMVICAGPTGSGKTTTLYATLTEINQSEYNIMTIEDPVEYVFPSINQTQINEQSGVTFANGLKAILRQDPDIILVGEIRDVETARIAVQSALTGHFVLSSLHATDAAAALFRFLDMGIESFLIASSVIAVVGQRLVRRMCSYCRVPYWPSPEELAFYRDAGGWPKAQFWHGEGCNFCARTGYQERTGVYEVLQVTDEVKQLLLSGASIDQLRALAVDQGMRPLREEALRLVAEDVTTIPEILRTMYVV